MSFARPHFWLRWWDRIRSSPIGYRLARGAFWSISGSILARLITLLSSILVARVLGRAGFGQLGIIQSTMATFSAFAGFGLGLTSTRYVAQLRQSDPSRAGRVLALAGVVALTTGALAAGALLTSAPWLAAHTLGAPHLTDELRISAALLLIMALNGAQLGALSGFEAFGTNALVAAASAAVMLPLMLLGSHLGGVRGCVWALVAAQAIHWLLLHLALRRISAAAGVPLSLRGWRSELSILHAFSLPVFLCSILVVPTTWICNTILFKTPGGAAEMGVFNMAFQWRTAILFIPATLNGTIIPILSNLYAQTGHTPTRSYRKLVLFNLGATTLITGLIAGGIALASPLIVAAYGSEFRDGQLVLIMVCASAVLLALNDVVGADLAGRGKVWIGAIFCGMVSCCLVGFSALLIPRYGARGLAGAILLSYFLHTLWQGTYLFRSLQVRPPAPAATSVADPAPASVV